MPPTEAIGAATPRAARSGPTRAMPVILLAVAALLLAARVGLGVYEHLRPVERSERVEWREPASGEAEAREGNRPVLYCFTRNGDPLCRQLARETFADPRIAHTLEMRFVPVRVLDLSREEGRNPPDVERLMQAYSVTEFPTLVVAFPGRERFQKQAGYRGALPTMEFLSRAAGTMMLPERPAR